MPKRLTIKGKNFPTIVNCIRQSKNARVSIRLYTHTKRIRSRMIGLKEYNSNKEYENKPNLEQRNELLNNFISHVDQKFVNIRSVLS